MKAFTDYPIIELGDAPYVGAPIREVDLLSYDGDKYCRVSVGGIEKSIKAGYIYKKPCRFDIDDETMFLSRQELHSLHNPQQ